MALRSDWCPEAFDAFAEQLSSLRERLTREHREQVERLEEELSIARQYHHLASPLHSNGHQNRNGGFCLRNLPTPVKPPHAQPPDEEPQPLGAHTPQSRHVVAFNANIPEDEHEGRGTVRTPTLAGRMSRNASSRPSRTSRTSRSSANRYRGSITSECTSNTCASVVFTSDSDAPREDADEDELHDGQFQLHPHWTLDDQTMSRLMRQRRTNGSKATAARVTRNYTLLASPPSGNVPRTMSRTMSQGAWPAWRSCGVPMFRPQGPFRMGWSLIGLVLILTDMVMVPMQVFDLSGTLFVVLLDWTTMIFWTLDILVNFRTGAFIRRKSNHIVMHPKAVAKHYAQTWLCFDLLIVVPDWVSTMWLRDESWGSSTSLLRALRIARILRLLRLIKMKRVLHDLQASANSNYLVLMFGIAKPICSIVLVAHIFACCWYWIGSQDDGWVDRHVTSPNDSDFYKYLTAMHWALAQFTSSSDVFAGTLEERGFAVVVVLFAIVLFSSFVSSITNMMVQLQSFHQERSYLQRTLRDFLHEHNISPELSMQTKMVVQNRLRQQQQSDYLERIQSLLPHSLLVEIYGETRLPVIIQHHFFEELSQEHPAPLRRVCLEAIEPMLVGTNELVWGPGQAGTCMSFISIGDFWYDMTKSTAKSQTRMAVLQQMRLSRKQWVCEVALWCQDWSHEGFFTCSASGEIYNLDAKKFAHTVGANPKVHVDVVLYARQFVATIEQVGCTDLGPKLPEVREQSGIKLTARSTTSLGQGLETMRSLGSHASLSRLF